MTEDKLISMNKLIDYLKSAKIDTRDIPDRRYLYAQGRNILADLIVIAAVFGEFDPDKPESIEIADAVKRWNEQKDALFQNKP